MKYNDQIRTLFYDIETLPLGADLFSTGKQVVRHGSLQPNRDVYDIITIQYKWAHEKGSINLSWIGKEKDSSGIIKDFDEQVKKADILIGKNSDRFDSKHINTLRLVHGLPPLPDWGIPESRDDLEKQIRKHFYLPSYSLDYLCKMLFNSGKNNMEFQDWRNIRAFKEVCQLIDAGVRDKDINIVSETWLKKSADDVIKDGEKSLQKMQKYGDKDVKDTEKAWNKVYDYVKPRHNIGRIIGNTIGGYLRCKHCGSDKIVKNGVDNRLSTPKQKFYCQACKREAGKAVLKSNGKFGKIS